jgi:hypothetical protein
MTDNNIYKAIEDYVSDSYFQQAQDEGIEWNEKYDAFVEPHVASLYNQVSQAVEMYMTHFAEPLPIFAEETTNNNEETNE